MVQSSFVVHTGSVIPVGSVREPKIRTEVKSAVLRLVVSVGSFVRPCVRACVRTCEKRKRKPHARAPGCTFDL